MPEEYFDLPESDEDDFETHAEADRLESLIVSRKLERETRRLESED